MNREELALELCKNLTTEEMEDLVAAGETLNVGGGQIIASMYQKSGN